jgi:hypothetical protein
VRILHHGGQRRIDRGDVVVVPGGLAAEIDVRERQVLDRPAAEEMQVERGMRCEPRRKRRGLTAGLVAPRGVGRSCDDNAREAGREGGNSGHADIPPQSRMCRSQ